MQKFNKIPFQALLLFFFLAVNSESIAQIQVGVGKTDVTPPLGTPVAGYYVERLATNVHDPLFARAMVIEGGANTLVMVIVDVIDVASSAFPAARKRIASEFNIPSANIVISATHSHTSPVLIEEYQEVLVVKIFDAVTIAMQNLQPAVIKSGVAKEENVSFHRRFMMKDGTVKFNPGTLNPDIVKPMGPIDPNVGILFIETADGKPIAIMVNFALHLDTIGGTEISADFPYFMEQVLKKVLGDEAMVFFGFGTCGNVNHINVNKKENLEKYERSRRIGYALAASVIRELPGLTVNDVNMPSSSSEMLHLKIPEYTEEQVAEARINAKKEFDGLAATPEIREAMKILRIHDMNNQPIEAEVITFGLGDVGIVALPGEVFVELGLDIKKRSPFKHTLVLTLANNSIGYIPNLEAFTYGAYEVEVSRIAAGEGEKLVESSVQLLESMK